MLAASDGDDDTRALRGKQPDNARHIRYEITLSWATRRNYACIPRTRLTTADWEHVLRLSVRNVDSFAPRPYKDDVNTSIQARK